MINENTSRFGRKYLHLNTYFVSFTTLINLLFLDIYKINSYLICRLMLIYFKDLPGNFQNFCNRMCVWLNVVAYNSIECHWAFKKDEPNSICADISRS